MVVRTFSAVLQGMQPVKIEVEVDSTTGTPQFLIIGLPTKEIDEAKERITAALLNCGVRLRAKRTIVNLAPADIRKVGSGLELAIAVGLLKMFEETHVNTDEMLFFGELALDGMVKPVRGALPLTLAARDMGYRSVVLPAGNSQEVATVSGIQLHPVSHLSQVIRAMTSGSMVPATKHVPFSALAPNPPEVDLSDITGQSLAKRALEIAATGGHNLLLVGPPGAGKSMLAQALPGILPPLSEGEATAVTAIYSVAGLLTSHQSFMTQRPFRSPHHTTSLAGLTGGGVPLLPGEISLAHLGVLFLDELPEFPKHCLEALRQPLEQRSITITRASGSYHFPAEFALVAAANPCPCGYFGSAIKTCRCSRMQQKQYANRISGPLLDRFDLQVWTTEVPISTLHQAQFARVQTNLESSTAVRQRVAAARLVQHERSMMHHVERCNAELTSRQLKQICQLTPEARRLLAKASTQLQLSARGYARALKVARTIADLSGQELIDAAQIAEALQFRQSVWGTARQS